MFVSVCIMVCDVVCEWYVSCVCLWCVIGNLVRVGVFGMCIGGVCLWRVLTCAGVCGMCVGLCICVCGMC